MPGVSLRGIVIGGIVDVMASVFLGLAFFFVATASYASRHPGLTLAQIDAALRSSPLVSIVDVWLVGGACSVLGGYVAARIATRDEILNGALSAWLCVLSAVLFWSADSTAVWQHILSVMASPLFGAAGGFLLARQRTKTIATT